MFTILIKAAAGLISLATLGTGATGPTPATTTDSPDTRAAASESLPKELVNGGFQYQGNEAIDKRAGGTRWLTFVDSDGMAMQGSGAEPWTKVSSTWKRADFGWMSDDSFNGHDSVVELQRRADAKNDGSDNVWAEIAAATRGKYVYQDIDTANTGDVMYRVRLNHASRNPGTADSMQVLVGAPGHETPVTVKRVASKAGDKVGEESTTITSTGTGQTDGWDTYEGTVVVPAGQDVTRFTFKSLKDVTGSTSGLNDAAEGNLIDDVTFEKAYPLNYDGNGGKGQVPSSTTADATQPAAAKTTGSVHTAADTAGVENLVNGDFEYPGAKALGVDHSDYRYSDWAGVERRSGQYFQRVNGKWDWRDLAGFDGSKFGWDSSETDGPSLWENQRRANEVEVQLDLDGNMYAELAANQAGTAIRQTIATTKGVSYTVSLRHASLLAGHVDKMRVVMVAADGTRTVVPMTRTGANGNGDKVGEKSDVVATKTSNTNVRDHAKQWETYEGTYIATSASTTFTFENVSSITGNSGNLLDDVSFRTAYPLGYSGNGGTGSVPSSTTADTTQPAVMRTVGSVRNAAASPSVPTHDLETTDVPANYRTFILDTTKTKLADVRFDPNWVTSKDGAGQDIHWPTAKGASATLPDVGEWTAPDGSTHTIRATVSLASWNGGNIGQRDYFADSGKVVGDGLFWINTVYDDSQVPAAVRRSLGAIDTSKRVGCRWTVSFTYEDGTPVPDTFKGVTGFNDLDGWDAQPDLRFEGVQLVSGFDGAYKSKDAELASYGTNGWAGVNHDAGDETDLDGAQQVKHRLAATWTGGTFTFGYDLSNPKGRTDGCRMTFGAPVTRTQVLTYDGNGGQGQVPSSTTADTTQPAVSTTTGTVRPASAASASTDTGVHAVESTVRQGDQEISTKADGRVVVRTIADETGAGDTVYAGCQVYYPAGATINLATAAKDDDCWDSSMLTKTNSAGDMQFLGWNQENDPHNDVTTADEAKAANVVGQITMPAASKTVFAVWANLPVLKYDVAQPEESKQANPTAPTTPDSITGVLNQPVADGSSTPDQSNPDKVLWKTGDTDKLKGWRFDGWYTAVDGNQKYDWSTPLTQAETVVHAHWTRLTTEVRYDANGGEGSHAATPGPQYSTITTPGDFDKAFHRTGYRLSGWNTKADGSGVEYKPGDGVPVEADPVTLYAQWTPLLSVLPTAGGTGGPAVNLPLLAGLGSLAAIAVAAWGVFGLRRRLKAGASPVGRHGR